MQHLEAYRLMQDTSEMEHVCEDVNSDSEWKFDSDNHRYVRFDANGKLMSHIRGESLPNPDILWQKRVKIYGRQSRDAVKPQAATYALWQHWQGVKNA